MKLICTFLFSFLIAANASALTLNGVNYKQYTEAGTKCPDASSVVIYNAKKYCKSYLVNISWTIPSIRVNGVALPLNQLKGYEIYWTRTFDNAAGTIKLGSGNISQYTWDVYTPGTYYFSMSAIDTTNVKSALSPVVQVKIGN